MDMNDLQQLMNSIEAGTAMVASGAKSARNIKDGVTTFKSLFTGSREKSERLETHLAELDAEVKQLESKLGDQTPTESFPVVEPVDPVQSPTGGADSDAPSEEWVRAQLLAVLGCVKSTLESVGQLNEIQQKNVDSMQQVVDVVSRLNKVSESHNEILRSHTEALQLLAQIAKTNASAD